MREYETRLQEVEELKKRIKNSAKTADGMEKEMTRIHNVWYPQLIAVIEIINENFQRFMESMNCAGEVELIRKEEVCSFAIGTAEIGVRAGGQCLSKQHHTLITIHSFSFSAITTNMALKFASNIEPVNAFKRWIDLCNQVANERLQLLFTVYRCNS